MIYYPKIFGSEERDYKKVYIYFKGKLEKGYF